MIRDEHYLVQFKTARREDAVLVAAVGADLHPMDAPSENIEERIVDAADAVLTEQVNIEVEEAEGERPTDE